MKLNSRLLILFIPVLLLQFSCKKGGGSSDQNTLLFLLFYNASVADFNPVLGFPGTINTVTSTGSFTGSSSTYTVTVDSVSATGVTVLDVNTLQFIMPSLSKYSENTTVNITVTGSGAVILSKTIRYRPAPPISLNVPNAFNRPISAQDPSSFFTVTIGSSVPHIFNVFGYLGTDLNLYYYSSPTSSATTIAASGMTDSEFERVNMTAGTYILQVKFVSGFNASYKTNIANGTITAATNSNEIDDYRRCYDYMATGTSQGTGCADVNAAHLADRTGRCTFPTSQGIFTRSYYLFYSAQYGGMYGFTASYAQTTCTQPGYDSPNPDKAIFESL
ncbi:hypothetical protein LEP1GSC058_4017 [Leptospira fainei serovar Hurstbridge str. BUT 6]|uniref:Uncharacterized protein n=1 Tax=Leptospira fainei serovar Hurstbridge str. BUT 6 TaxID=1193011 RepID=S3UWQ5_9LEPT|nr:hypothetical protein [Leptospira fainei]EPG73703.1 hypothetical protein LEP1GSC058_4017 [Leptospira fainei serovar Hurstbridge str. BUT 6]